MFRGRFGPPKTPRNHVLVDRLVLRFEYLYIYIYVCAFTIDNDLSSGRDRVPSIVAFASLTPWIYVLFTIKTTGVHVLPYQNRVRVAWSERGKTVADAHTRTHGETRGLIASHAAVGTARSRGRRIIISRARLLRIHGRRLETKRSKPARRFIYFFPLFFFYFSFPPVTFS